MECERGERAGTGDGKREVLAPSRLKAGLRTCGTPPERTDMPAGDPILTIRDLVVRYGAIEALHGVSLAVMPGQIVTLIGANGAGKSSLLRSISALVPASGGRIEYDPAAGGRE